MAENHPLELLVQALRRLPGVGVKSAQRMAYHLLQHDREGALHLAQALQHACAEVRHCALCHTFTEDEVCATCRDPRRDHSQLCVVENPADLAPMERTGAYKGLYFVLMGKLSPLDDVGPRDIGLQKLFDRVDAPAGGEAGAEREGREVILRSEEHTSELQSQSNLVCRPLPDKNPPTGDLSSSDMMSVLLCFLSSDLSV